MPTTTKSPGAGRRFRIGPARGTRYLAEDVRVNRAALGMIAMVISSAGFALAGSAAHAAEGWYVSGQAGASFLSYADLDDPTGTLAEPDTKFDFDIGFNVAGAIGYAFINNFRVEAEVNYAKHDIDQFTTTTPCVGFCLPLFGSGEGRRIIGGGGDVTAVSFMANAFYDIDTGGRWRPYLGGGAGIAIISVNDVAISGVPLADDDDTVFAFQLGAGIGYEFTPTTTLSFDYRFFSTADPDFKTADGTPFGFEYHRHDIRAGVRFSF